MGEFPRLKTSAIAQYPAEKAWIYSTQVVRFVDGSEQRFPEYGAALRRWVIRLDLLDEGELAAIDEFFQVEQGRFSSFSFTDPWTGTDHPNCTMEHDEAVLAYLASRRGQTELVVKENRT